MFEIDKLDTRHAAGMRRRFICIVCRHGFDSENGSQICPDCIAREPTPIQDNDPEGGGWILPSEPAAVVVARLARAEAERQAAEYRRAMLFLHQIVSAIAGAADRPLRLLPRDQHRVAKLALEQFQSDFPQIIKSMDLHEITKS